MKVASLYAVLTSIFLVGCQPTGMYSNQHSGIGPYNGSVLGGVGNLSPAQQAQYFANSQAKLQPIVVSATGYAAPLENNKVSKAQARLLTLRGSKIDAYRNLSERVYGLKLRGSSSLRSMMTAHDELQTFVDAYLMGAKVVSQRELEDGSFETIVEMALQENFQQCVLNPQSIATNPACQMAYNNMDNSMSMGNNQTAPLTRAQPTTTNFYSIK